jgi:hypothetical protein
MNKLSIEDQKKFKNKLTIAFRNLRKVGYIAKQNFWCCQTCGWAAIEEKNPDVKKVIFYHHQDADDIPYGKVMLAWDGDAEEIKQIVSMTGLMLSGGETSDKRIQATYLDDLKNTDK